MGVLGTLMIWLVGTLLTEEQLGSYFVAVSSLTHACLHVLFNVGPGFLATVTVKSRRFLPSLFGCIMRHHAFTQSAGSAHRRCHQSKETVGKLGKQFWWQEPSCGIALPKYSYSAHALGSSSRTVYFPPPHPECWLPWTQLQTVLPASLVGLFDK